MKLGHIDYLNAYPLYWKMLHGYSPPKGVSLVSRAPAVLNAMMRSGELDVSLVSTATLPDIQNDVFVLPEYCIGSLGAVHSVLLLSKCPMTELDEQMISLTSESETSVVLLRYLLEHCEGLKPQYTTCRDGGNEEILPAAYLRIGNDALTADRTEYPYVYDLGQLWCELTGLPMVYAVFVVRSVVATGQDVLLAAVRKALAVSLAAARADRSNFVDIASAAYPTVVADLSAYYEVLKYDLTEVYQRGLRMFFDKMADARLLRPMGDVKYMSGDINALD